MSASHRFIFSTFLFLALSCFGASFSFASSHVYYKFGNNQCSFNKTDACASALQGLNNIYVGTGVTYTSLGCTGYDPQLAWRRQRYNYVAQNYYEISEGTSGAGQGFTVECDGQVTLNADCSTTCGDDPCMAKKDQTVELEEICGLSQCPSGATFSATEQVCKKPNGATVPAQSVYSIPAAGQTESFQGCEVVSQPSPDAAGRGYFKDEELGSGELTTYCPVTYKYTGNKGSDSPDTGQNTPSTDATSPSLEDIPKLPPGLYLPEADGGCKSGDSFGQYGAGDSSIDVCVPGSDGSGDGDSGATCPATGQIKVNGTCQCTTSGYVVKNGACSAPDSNPDPNPNPDGTTCPNNLPKNPDGSCPSANTTGSGGGSYTASEKCAKAPTCSGDVVQCGLMQESHKAKCDLLEQIGSVPDDVKNAADSLGEAVTDNANINGWAQTTNGYMNILQGLLIPSNSSCNITDIKLQVLAKEINIPLIQFCPFFELVKLLLNITVDLVVIRIVSRAVLSSNV